MANIYDTFASDKKLADSGVKFDLDGMFSFELDGIKYVTAFHLKHLSATNIDYQRTLQRLQKPHLKAIRKDKLDPAIEIELSIRAFCTCILVGWENLPIRDKAEFEAIAKSGQLPVVPHSYDNAVRLMNDMPELMELLADLARDPQNFQTSSVEELKKMGNESVVDSNGSFPTMTQNQMPKSESTPAIEG